MQILELFCLGVGILASIRMRFYLLMWRSEPKESLLSRALAQLVGTAGGIYLSLELLFSFLKIPETVWNETMFPLEPLALVSLILAIIQPFAIRAWLKIRK